MLEEQLEEDASNDEESSSTVAPKKPAKRGIIYLSTIPQYMNVSRIREVLGKFGKIENVYLQLANTGQDQNKKKKKPKNVAKLFTEGWVEFERKSVAKRVAQLLNNKQVDTRKGSKQYDCMWNIKYLPRFKWVHLHERLNHERHLRRKKLQKDIEAGKNLANSFKARLGKKKSKTDVNMEVESLDVKEPESEDNAGSDRDKFLQSAWE